MEISRTETLYLRDRARVSLAMAAAATEPCAQLAHQTLARLYGEAIAVVRQHRPTLTLRATIPA